MPGALSDTPTWVEQVSLLLVMVIAFLGAAAGVHNHTHLSVVIFRNIVPSVRSLPLTISGALLFLFSIGHLIRLFLGRDERQDNIDQG